MFLGVERAARRHLDHIAPPFGLGAVELDEMAAPAGALPRDERQILHLADADVAEHRNALGFHPGVIGGRLFLELAETGLPRARRLVPMGRLVILRIMRHGVLQNAYRSRLEHCGGAPPAGCGSRASGIDDVPTSHVMDAKMAECAALSTAVSGGLAAPPARRRKKGPAAAVAGQGWDFTFGRNA